MPDDLYDRDVLAWSTRQADLLRRFAAGERVNEQIDWENVAEEIDSVGKSQRTALASHIRVVLEHLMKLEASPAREPRRVWRETIRRTRREIETLLEDSPSLRREVDPIIKRRLPAARRDVAATLADFGETPRVALDDLGYDADAVLGEFLPVEEDAAK